MVDDQLPSWDKVKEDETFIQERYDNIRSLRGREDSVPTTQQKEKSMNDTFLPPIEKPHGLIMKLAYYFTRLEFGKVLTPLKVHSARLPPAFGLFYTKIGKLD